jgi:superfamily II DNA or RNA helicase
MPEAYEVSGYIYARTNELCDIHDCYKLGTTRNIPDREANYITSEINRGRFKYVYEIQGFCNEKCEQMLFQELKRFNLYKNAGTEFYRKDAIKYIEPFFKKHNIKYKKMSAIEIANLIRINREYIIGNESSSQDAVGYYRELSESSESSYESDIEYCKSVSYIPREYQSAIISNALSYFQFNNNGILALICGVGKTLISIWIAKELNCNTIVIGVPNILLLKQWKNTIKSILPDLPIFIVSKDIKLQDIIQFFENEKNCFIIITTYASSHKVRKAFEKTQIIPHIKILDEVHHLTTYNIDLKTKSYVNILKIQSRKQLSLTATLKILENKENVSDADIIISNDNVKYFGNIIDKRCLLWAINENIICDYVIQSITIDTDKLEYHLHRFKIIEENDKRLFLSAFSSLKSIFENHSHHILIYSNKMSNSIKIVKYIKLLIEEKYFIIPGLYYSAYHSNHKAREQKDIIDKFETANYGIISCVYCLGEGWDFPLLDAVVCAENMSSNIRILQSVLRASRKNKNQPDKITKIILPILNKDDLWENDNQDLKKIREVIYQMGLEDETITQKIKAFNIEIKKEGQLYKPLLPNTVIESFGEFDNDFTQKLRLKTVKRMALTMTHEKARKIIASKNIKNKEEYYKLCEIDSRLSPDPELDFKGTFTNWINYLSIERIYYDLKECKNKICEYLLLYPEIKKNYLDLSIVCTELCKIDPLFPPNGLWVEYYNVRDLKDIIELSNKKKNRGVAI